MADAQQITVLGRDAKFKGELTFDSSLKVLGLLEGVIRAGGEVTIAEGGLIKGDVEAATIIVEGTVEGDLIAKSRLHLTAKARVVGDITAASLVVAEGATFIGHCRVGGDAIAKTKSEMTTREIDAPAVETKPLKTSVPAMSAASTPSSGTPGKSTMPSLNIPPMPTLQGLGASGVGPGNGWMNA